MTSDHIGITTDVQSRYPAPFYEPISLLGWLAGITSTIEMGMTVIIVPYRNVFEIARACANVAQLSGGRFILGVGIGWAQQEFQAAMGHQVPPPRSQAVCHPSRRKCGWEWTLSANSRAWW